VLRLALFGIDGAAQSRIDALKVTDSHLWLENNRPIRWTCDIVGNGLDPHISIARRFTSSRAWRVRAA